jgi:DNA polymerase III subunit epsilon
VQVGIAVCDGLDFSTIRTFRTYVKPCAVVAWTAARVHGITPAVVADAPAFADLWPTFRAMLGGRVVVAHAAATERRHLRAFPFHGFGPWVDSLAVARAAWPAASSHKLGSLAAGGDGDDWRAHAPGLGWHDALFDSLAALAVLRRAVGEWQAWDWPAGDLANPRLARERHRG